MTNGPADLNAEFLRGLPDEGPVVMLNLVRLKEKTGASWDAYLAYSQAMRPLLKAAGATILWAGDVEGAAYGKLDGKRWDYSVLVQYPSRANFLAMVTSPDYAAANVYREAGLADHLILATKETYSKLAAQPS